MGSAVPLRASSPLRRMMWAGTDSLWFVDSPEDEFYYECDPDDNILGYLSCTLSNGGKSCATSSLPDGGYNCPADAGSGSRGQRPAGGGPARMHRRDHPTTLHPGENHRAAFGPPACHDLRSLPETGL